MNISNPNHGYISGNQGPDVVRSMQVFPGLDEFQYIRLSYVLEQDIPGETIMTDWPEEPLEVEKLEQKLSEVLDSHSDNYAIFAAKVADPDLFGIDDWAEYEKYKPLTDDEAPNIPEISFNRGLLSLYIGQLNLLDRHINVFPPKSDVPDEYIEGMLEDLDPEISAALVLEINEAFSDVQLDKYLEPFGTITHLKESRNEVSGDEAVDTLTDSVRFELAELFAAADKFEADQETRRQKLASMSPALRSLLESAVGMSNV